jgi:mRNA interferase HigB
VRVIAVSHLRAFWQKHAEAEQSLRAWVKAAVAAEWKRPSDIAAQFTTASVFKSRHVVFNIKGNEYRLVVAVAYRFGAVYVKFVGTHREYDRIDANTVEMS